MNKVRHILCFCLILSGMAVSAQTYDHVFRRNFWNGSRNAAGIRLDSLSRSYAEAYGSYSGGGFKDTWQAEDTWSAGAVTKSIRHLENISLAGSFSFDQTEGYDMCGSMLMNPGYYPVDVLEFTPGRKTLQTYSFDGRISYDISDRWSIGAGIDFISANMAKRKDLRHSNWMLDLTVAPGVTYKRDGLTIGASPVFRKTSEAVDAEQIGTAESSYYAFFDKGLMYGVHQVWTGSGVHLYEAGVNSLPVREYSFGGAMQMQHGGLYADVEYLRTSGSVGEKEYIWYEFPGHKVSAGIHYRFIDDAEEHYVKLRFDWSVQDMSESILEKVTENGVSTVINHGSNGIYSRERWAVVPEYDFVSDRIDLHAEFAFEGFNGISFQMYPYVMSQSVMTLSAQMSATVHLGRFDLTVDLGCSEGDVQESERKVSDIQAQTSPYRLKDWYDRQMEYRTAARLMGGLSVRYNFMKGIYVEAGGDWLHGMDLKYLGGADRFGASMKLGYMF